MAGEMMLRRGGQGEVWKGLEDNSALHSKRKAIAVEGQWDWLCRDRSPIEGLPSLDVPGRISQNSLLGRPLRLRWTLWPSISGASC